MAAAGRIALLIGCLLLSAPALGGSSGAKLHEEILALTGAYDDPELVTYLEGLVRDIVSVSEMAGEEFTFTLVDSGDINAFATAGNYVYVNRGILNYIRNEAQLVSVLAHEVGHITQRHVSVMPAAAGGARFLAWLAGALSGSAEVFEAGNAYANSLLKGHGRDNELQADKAAARYMAKLGYDPNEMLEMLGTMKDLEIMQKERAAQGGAPRRAYHGIFASHPRNDTRLRSAVSKSKAIETSATRVSGEERYRRVTEGLVWGENFKEKEVKPERYADRKLRIRFNYPDGWTHKFDNQVRAVVGQPEGGEARLSMQVHPRTPQDPEEYLYNHLNIPQLKQGKAINPSRLKGFAGILPGADGQADQRVAVIFYKLNAFLFTGEVAQQATFESFDPQFLESIDTFRPISNREIEGQKPQTIHWVKATEATTFDGLGEYLKLNAFEVQDLRLINGHYPTGEPKPGEWIRLFRQE